MNYRIVLILAATMLLPGAEEGPDLVARMDRVAEVATAMVDGDVCLRMETPRSLEYARLKDPRDPWRASDNYDVDHAAFLTTKRTLIRLSRLCGTPCDVNLWMPSPSATGRVRIAIRNVHELSQFWKWGDADQETPAEMKQVFETSRRVSVRQRAGMVSVLAPVFDSVGDVVAVAEVVTEEKPDPRENVK